MLWSYPATAPAALGKRSLHCSTSATAPASLLSSCILAVVPATLSSSVAVEGGCFLGMFISDMLEIREIKCGYDITKKQQYGWDSSCESQPYCCPMCFTSEGEDNTNSRRF
jgi:hypothetical protein